jgi:hypothetical protein
MQAAVLSVLIVLHMQAAVLIVLTFTHASSHTGCVDCVAHMQAAILIVLPSTHASSRVDCTLNAHRYHERRAFLRDRVVQG